MGDGQMGNPGLGEPILMEKIVLQTLRMPFLALCFVIIAPGCARDSQPPTRGLPPAELKEYETVQRSLLDPRNADLLNAAGWTLAHAADGKDVEQAAKAWGLLQAFADSSKNQQLVEAGGIKGLRGNVAGLLKSKDPVVRGFAAILLAVIGADGYKNDIARLLEDKKGPPGEDWHKFVYNFDRSRAAMALGLMGAKEFAPRLSALLRSSDAADRAGAALGLGYMRAEEYVSDIAKLLDDNDDQARVAAMQALGELGAKQYAREIAGLLASLGDPMVSETACYALARLNAKQESKALGGLLKEDFRKRNAAKALALLGAKEYTRDIAQLIQDSDALVRCDALIALGILDAREYTESVAAHLQDKEGFVRPYAAVALVLMCDQTHTKEILALMRPEEKGTSDFDVQQYVKLHPVVQDRCNELRSRANDTLKRLSQTGKEAQQGSEGDHLKPAP
jgi:HEAT repeat protein